MVKLTSYAAKGGCACKIGPHILAEVLKGLDLSNSDPRVLVNMEGSDDAGVFKLNEEQALVQTLDFFTPPVDDPYLFGAVAACNSLSDIYAMGGKPLTAMNIVAFPVPLVKKGVLNEVLRGAADILKEAEVALLGGHSIEDEVPKYGLSITGVVHPQKIWQNKGAKIGDALVLTKPLGTGIMNTAHKGGLFEAGVLEAQISMKTLNKLAAQVASAYSIHACTDITGFSLLGHLREMVMASKVSATVNVDKLPLFTSVIEAAQMGLVPAATYGNRKAIDNISFAENLEDYWSDICFDPQTSGGLLFSLAKAEAVELITKLHEQGLCKASIIGEIVEKGDSDIYVR